MKPFLKQSTCQWCHSPIAIRESKTGHGFANCGYCGAGYVKVPTNEDLLNLGINNVNADIAEEISGSDEDNPGAQVDRRGAKTGSRKLSDRIREL